MSLTKEGTKTVQDARVRISDARAGSLALKPTLEYLRELRKGILEWGSEVEDAIAWRESRQQACPECGAAQDCDEDCGNREARMR